MMGQQQYEPELNTNRKAIKEKALEAEQVRTLLFAVGGVAAVEAWEKATDKGKEEGERQTARRANRDFTQVTPQGWDKLDEIVQKDPSAARLFAFFCKNMGPDGAVTASRSTLAEALNTTERTITRYVKALSELDALIVLKVGTANVYCLNPEQVWKSFNNAKPYAAFNTKTLVGKSENKTVKRRLAVVLKGRRPEEEQADFLDALEIAWPESDDDDMPDFLGSVDEPTPQGGSK